MPGLIYLVHEYKFIKAKKPIYILGKINQLNDNLTFDLSFPKRSQIKILLSVDGSDDVESKLLTIFDKKFTKVPDLGEKHYMGSLSDMLNEICMFSQKNDDINFEDYIMTKVISHKIEIVPDESKEKMNSLFYPIFNDFVYKILNRFTSYKMFEFYQLYNLHRIQETNGRAYRENSLVIDFDPVVQLIKKEYEYPSLKNPVQHDSYQKFVGFINSLSSMNDNINAYIKAWNAEKHSKYFVKIKCKSIKKIPKDEYVIGLLKCAWSRSSQSNNLKFISWKKTQKNIMMYEQIFNYPE